MKEKISIPFDDGKKKLILEFFIRHFIEMARKSNEFRTYGQGLMYVMQAENLLKLYNELGYEGIRENMGVVIGFFIYAVILFVNIFNY